MNDQEKKLSELAEKAKQLDSTMKHVSFRMRRTLKNIKVCRETCKSTNALIDELAPASCKEQA